MQGQVYKIHSDFYYVKPQNGGETLECKLREILKKQKVKIKVGDFVEVEDGGAVCRLLDRKNTILRPPVSNLDMAVVVSSLMNPAFDYIQLNRYLTFLKYNNIEALLCFNKDDLPEKDELERIKDEIHSIYEPLGYKIIFTSALYNDGLNEFIELIKNRTIAFSGMSGVGKSSILNVIAKGSLRVGNVSSKNKKGCHTTRHSEIIEIGDTKVIDTPGFSKLTFDFILPKDLTALFDDINFYAKGCRYSDCLHERNDSECNVILNLDKISKSRYESYLNFLAETKEYKKRVTFNGQKEESAAKNFQERNFTKISAKKRSFSRKKTNQDTKKSDF